LAKARLSPGARPLVSELVRLWHCAISSGETLWRSRQPITIAAAVAQQLLSVGCAIG